MVKRSRPVRVGPKTIQYNDLFGKKYNLSSSQVNDTAWHFLDQENLLQHLDKRFEKAKQKKKRRGNSVY